jgi:hypothetical protein
MPDLHSTTSPPSATERNTNRRRSEVIEIRERLIERFA